MALAAHAAHESELIAIAEASAVGQARRAAAALGARLGLSDTDLGRLGLVVTELGTNLVQHAGVGQLVLRGLTVGTVGVEVLSLDRAQGMADIGQCLADGFSTGGSRGVGLGSISRNSDAFEIVSRPDAGSAVYARIGAKATPSAGAVCIAMTGEDVSGDAWAVREVSPFETVVTVVDGLGHGPDAARAARAAVDCFVKAAATGPGELLELMHGELRVTRGAAVAIARLSWAQRVLTFAGVGNISGTVFSGASAAHHLASHNGIVGQPPVKIREFSYALPADPMLILHSDGLATRWSLDTYPGLAAKAPTLVAGVLYRDFSRGRDDVTVLVVRPKGSGE